jgi:hypothetical protein
MKDLVRLKPDPIPLVRPIPEHLAEGDLKARYDDMKAVLGVPWMGVVTMSFAHYRHFYDALWRGVRPLCAGGAFAAACRGLRADVETTVKALAPPPITDRLAALGYAPREIAQIQEIVEVFSHGNFPYLLLATIARLLLEGEELDATDAMDQLAEQRRSNLRERLVLMEPHHADPTTGRVFEEVKATLGLPFVNTDYRALARWPSYFALAWSDLRLKIAQPAYEALAAGVHAAAVATARSLPNPGLLRAGELRAAAGSGAREGEVLSVVRLFQWLLPGLVTNIAFFRAQFL